MGIKQKKVISFKITRQLTNINKPNKSKAKQKTKQKQKQCKPK